MARERYLIGINPEELKPDDTPKPPMTPKQKLVKFWYRYHWAVIFFAVVIAVGIAVGVGISQRENYDYTLVMVTKDKLPTNAVSRLSAELASMGDDIDGDGECKVLVLALSMTDAADYTQLCSIFAGGDAVFFAMEPAYYQSQIAEIETDDTAYFMDLSVTGHGISENGRYWNWNGSAEQADYADEMPQNLYFGVRRPIGSAAAKSDDSAACLALLEEFIAFSNT